MTASPSLQRRRLVALAGGGLVLAATAPLAGCAATPADAVAAWQPAPEPDLRRFMLAHALLAPNPHNLQPWIADLRRPGEITLRVDPARLLPATDPHGRQIVVGCGAFVELAVIAAAERGHAVRVVPFPEGEPGPRELPGGRAVARLEIVPQPGLPRDPLFAQIPRRHTHKGAYDSSRAVPADAWARLLQAGARFGLQAGAVTDAQRMQALWAQARSAYAIECTTPATWLESAHLMRIGPDAIARHRDGISITATMPRLMHAIGMFDPMEVPVRGTSGFDRVMDRFAAMETGSGFLWIASTGGGRAAELAAGRAYVRAHLEATAAGIDMHPLSQALQEFAEVRGPYEAVHRLLGIAPGAGTVQMLARVGYGRAPSQPSPRRELAGMMKA